MSKWPRKSEKRSNNAIRAKQMNGFLTCGNKFFSMRVTGAIKEIRVPFTQESAQRRFKVIFAAQFKYLTSTQRITARLMLKIPHSSVLIVRRTDLNEKTGKTSLEGPASWSSFTGSSLAKECFMPQVEGDQVH